ncbi:hypothetical protein ACLB2K_020098 [Fragaria x ananassa]
MIPTFVKVIEMGSKENNQGLVRNANFQGPRLGYSKFVKDIGHNHRAALSNITNFKREASGNVAAGDKKLSNLGHRPITRRFSAQMIQQCPKGTKKPSSSTVNPNDFVDCEIIDVEDSEDEDSDAVPMYVKHTEAMLDEIDRMEEDEESEDPIMDIDTSCMKDALSVVEYIDDIYAHYRKTENQSCVSPSYMARQPDINEKMRAILIDWLIEVHYKFELMDETLFLTINLIDRFLERHVVVRKKLQLVGVTAMLLACKYEEVSVPIVEDFVLISDKAYTREDVLGMEKSMAAQSNKKLELLSFFLIELCLVEYEMLKFPPSLLAAAAIYTAQCSLSKFKQWSKTCEWYTNYSEDELQECSRMMVTFHQKAETGRLTGVHRKYSTWKFGYAAKAEPAEFLLNP